MVIVRNVCLTFQTLRILSARCAYVARCGTVFSVRQVLNFLMLFKRLNSTTPIKVAVLSKAVGLRQLPCWDCGFESH